MPQKKQKKSGNGKGTKRKASAARLRSSPGKILGGSSGLGRPSTTAQATSVGVVLPQSMFRFDGRAQALSDYGGMGDSVRVCGTDLFSIPIQAGSSTKEAGFGTTQRYWIPLTPAYISQRLINLEELFQYYAIRTIQIMYSPEVATTKSVSVAIGVSQDNESMVSNVSAPTQQQLLELTPAMKCPAYQPASIEYKHTGTRVWKTSSTNDTTDYSDYEQLTLGCTLSGADLATSVQYGSLWLSYVIDFYKPCPVQSNPALLRRRAERLEARLASLIEQKNGAGSRDRETRSVETKAEKKEVLATPLNSPRLRQLRLESSTGDFELVGGERTSIPSARPGPPEKSGTGSVDGQRSGWFRA